MDFKRNPDVLECYKTFRELMTHFNNVLYLMSVVAHVRYPQLDTPFLKGVDKKRWPGLTVACFGSQALECVKSMERREACDGQP